MHTYKPVINLERKCYLDIINRTVYNNNDNNITFIFSKQPMPTHKDLNIKHNNLFTIIVLLLYSPYAKIFIV